MVSRYFPSGCEYRTEISVDAQLQLEELALYSSFLREFFLLASDARRRGSPGTERSKSSRQSSS
jgi:hypothetical protein